MDSYDVIIIGTGAILGSFASLVLDRKSVV